MRRIIPDPTSGVDGDVAAVADLLHQINRKIRQFAHADGAAIDGTATHMTAGRTRALRQLRLSGEPIRMSDLADRLGIARRSVTTVVDDLERDGLVARVPDSSDRRATLVDITEAGMSALQQALDNRRVAAASVLGALDAEEVVALRDLLTRLTAAPRPPHP